MLIIIVTTIHSVNVISLRREKGKPDLMFHLCKFLH